MRSALGALPENERVDFGCAASHGGFLVDYVDDGPPTLTLSTPKHSLIFFLFSMLHRLQALGTVPAIDYVKYLASVNRLAT